MLLYLGTICEEDDVSLSFAASSSHSQQWRADFLAVSEPLNVFGIPVIDFGPFLVGCDEDRLRIATEFDRALRSVGFIYLCNHGIDQTKINTCFEWVSGANYLSFL